MGEIKGSFRWPGHRRVQADCSDQHEEREKVGVLAGRRGPWCSFWEFWRGRWAREAIRIEQRTRYGYDEVATIEMGISDCSEIPPKFV